MTPKKIFKEEQSRIGIKLSQRIIVKKYAKKSLSLRQIRFDGFSQNHFAPSTICATFENQHTQIRDPLAQRELLERRSLISSIPRDWPAINGAARVPFFN